MFQQINIVKGDNHTQELSFVESDIQVSRDITVCLSDALTGFIEGCKLIERGKNGSVYIIEQHLDRDIFRLQVNLYCYSLSFLAVIQPMLMKKIVLEVDNLKRKRKFMN